MGLVGVLAVGVGAFLWGTNYIVTKRYDMRDGMHFQLLQGTGILLVGVLTLLWAERVPKGRDYDDFPLPDLSATVSFEGLLGGVVWSLGNLLTIPLVSRIGVGLGLSIWSATGMINSFVLSRLSVFGLEPEELHPPAAAYAGAVLGVISLGIFGMVDTSSGGPADEGLAVESDGEGIEAALLPSASVTAATAESEDAVGADGGAGKQAGGARRRAEGVGMAVAAGLLYGFQFVPLTIHDKQYPKPDGVGEVTHQIRFFFSQFLGIYLTSMMSFIVYCITKRNKPELIPPEAVIPSLVSGMMWAVAATGSMVAVAELGLGIGFPLTTNGAFLVNACWSIFYFKEVTGRRNITIFAVAGFFNLLSCVCLAIARG